RPLTPQEHCANATIIPRPTRLRQDKDQSEEGKCTYQHGLAVLPERSRSLELTCTRTKTSRPRGRVACCEAKMSKSYSRPKLPRPVEPATEPIRPRSTDR